MQLRSLFIFSVCMLLAAAACKKEDNERAEPEAVDMTSTKTYRASVLWATCNLGATSPDTPGEYYTWGEDDPCAEKLGEGWRMPTREEFSDLLDACNVEVIQYAEGSWVVGCKLTSKATGNSLFFPVYGYKDELGKIEDYNQKVHNWTSVAFEPEYAESVRFSLDEPYCWKSKDSKVYGLQIRPVREP